MVFEVIGSTVAHEDSVWCVDWAESTIVTGSLDSKLKVWRVDEADDSPLKLEHTLEGHSLGITSIALSSLASTVVSSSMDNTVKIWNIKQPTTPPTTHTLQPASGWALALSPDGTTAVIVGRGDAISVLRLNTSEFTKITTSDAFSQCVCFHPDGRSFARGSSDGNISIFDLETQKRTKIIAGHSKPVRRLRYTPDGGILLSASDDHQIGMFDLSDKHLNSNSSSNSHSQSFRNLFGHNGPVYGIAVSPLGTQFASCSSDHTVMVWDVRVCQCMHTHRAHRDQVWDVQYGQDGSKLASVGEDKMIVLYSV